MSEQKTIRSMMVPVGGSDRMELGLPLISTEARHLHARTRLPTIFNMSVHSLLTASASDKETATVPYSKEPFKIKTLSGRMSYWASEYEAMAPSLDGKAREEYVKVASLAAIGQDESGQIATGLLEEGSKKLGQKDKK